VLFLGTLALALSAACSQRQRVAEAPSRPSFSREEAAGEAKRPAPASSTPAPAAGTPTTSGWKSYSHPDYNVTLQYPVHWERDPRSDLRFGGADGFLQLSAANADTLDRAAEAEANHKLRPYGFQPAVTTTRVQDQDARLILPSNDQAPEMKGQAALIVRYPKPVQIAGSSYPYLVLWADKGHVEAIADTLRFGGSSQR